jgi:hypothetical protein
MYSFKSRCLSHFAAVELFIRPDAPWAAQAVGAQLIEALPRDGQCIYKAGSNSKYLTPSLPRRGAGNDVSSYAEASIKEATRSSAGWSRNISIPCLRRGKGHCSKGFDRVGFAWSTVYDKLPVLSKLTSLTHHQAQISG